MTDKNYLVSIIQSAVGGRSTYWAGLIADALIAYGVTLQQWIPVTERTPIKEYEEAKAGGQNVYTCLAVVKLYGYNTPYITKVWHDGLGFIDINSIDISASVTHWMPLPKLPKDGE